MSELVLADTHCHLVLPELAADLPEVLQRARDAGVGMLVVPGVDVESSRRAVELAETWPGVFAAVGVHPHYAGGWSSQAQAELKALARSPRVVAVGEIGLDYYRNLASHDAQRTAFRAQLDLAGESHRPVILHSREALPDVFAELDGWLARIAGLNGRSPGVLHAFAGEAQDAQRAVELGFLLGVAGPITYPKSDPLRRVIAGVPLPSLVVETDAPYLSPVPHRGKRNEPAHVALVARRLAEVLGLDPALLSAATSDNAARLFGWMDEHTNRNLL
jgi:TatD DNase family protein